MTKLEPTIDADQLVWEAPGPGQWMLDTTHHGRRPVTGYLSALADESFRSIGVMFERYGLPLEGMSTARVNGCTYLRPRAVGEGDRPKPPPPRFVLKLVARLHPELRRRNRIAAEAWAEKRWRDDVDGWFERDRVIVVETNRRLTRVDLSALDDRGLVDHLITLNDHGRSQAVAGFENHGGDMVPVGDYLAHCQAWGIPADRAAALLQGASPASRATTDGLDAVRAALAARPGWPATLDDLRAVDEPCRHEVDRWLETFGWRVVSSDDLDAVTLAEQPDLQVAALVAAANARPVPTPDPEPVRQLLPPDDRHRFDELLAEARYGLPLRDDSVGVRWNWPVGLLRRALLEAGRRLVAAGRLHDPGHAVELTFDEVRSLLLAGDGPTAGEAAARRTRRLAVEATVPPATLGDPEPPPPLDAFPAPLARAARSILALIEAMEGKAEGPTGPAARPATRPASGSGNGEVVATGSGIGTQVVDARVRVVRGAEDALARVEPGEIVVAAFTGPAYNAILPLIGGLVVEEGGPLCHAAIVAREFDLPALIGAEGAMAALADGDRVRVDPMAGTLTRLGPIPD